MGPALSQGDPADQRQAYWGSCDSPCWPLRGARLNTLVSWLLTLARMQTWRPA